MYILTAWGILVAVGLAAGALWPWRDRWAYLSGVPLWAAMAGIDRLTAPSDQASESLPWWASAILLSATFAVWCAAVTAGILARRGVRGLRT